MERFVNGILFLSDGMRILSTFTLALGCAYIASSARTGWLMRRNEIPKNANLISLLEFLYQVFSF
jgi:hypothetical protein